MPGTLVRCPWLPGPTAQVLVMLDPELGMPSAVTDPRLAAMRMVERFKADGLTPVMAVELEFYLLQGDSATRRPPLPVTPRMVEVYSAVKRFECRQFMGEVTTQDYDWYLQTV